MYTEEMAKAFHMIKAPDGVVIDVMDCDNFLSLNIDPHMLVSLDKDTLTAAVAYINDVKKAFENLGAIVLISREAIQ
jgi:DNA-binding protein YbaB